MTDAFIARTALVVFISFDLFCTTCDHWSAGASGRQQGSGRHEWEAAVLRILSFSLSLSASALLPAFLCLCCMAACCVGRPLASPRLPARSSLRLRPARMTCAPLLAYSVAHQPSNVRRCQPPPLAAAAAARSPAHPRPLTPLPACLPPAPHPLRPQPG